VRDLFMTHLAVTDIGRGRYVAREKLNRAGIGWAGAATETYRVWNDQWQASLEPAARPNAGAAPGASRHRLIARDGDFGLDLTLDEGGPPVRHGDAGLSGKGDQAGNASYYYSLTRMPTRGTLIVGGEPVAVSGSSWMDHEFGTTILEPHQTGWDWFSIQLDDGTDLMVFQLRDRDGRAVRQSSGSLIPAGGQPMVLRSDAFTLKPGRTWTSRDSGASYPVEWDVQVPGAQLSVSVRAAVDAQELAKLSTGINYWEGAVTITGTRAGRPVTGRGYLEMTGYSGRPMGEIMR
jgi:predicted secreted hydrolase